MCDDARPAQSDNASGDLSDDPKVSLKCPQCGCRLIYDGTYPPGYMFDGISPEDQRRRQTHIYRCAEHGIFHLKPDGRIAKPTEHIHR